MLGAIFGGLGVACGAFGAHFLRSIVAPDLLIVYETAVRYQLFHALALLALGLAPTQWECRWFRIAGWMFVGGIVLFSGSLYLLSLTGTRWFGIFTPVGGMALLTGWVLLGVGAWKQRLSKG